MRQLLRSGFWTLNIGLTHDGVADAAADWDCCSSARRSNKATGIARSAEFMEQPIVDLLVWMRVPGDTIFSIGALLLAWFVLRLWIAPTRN